MRCKHFLVARGVLNKLHIIQRFILIEFTASESFSKRGSHRLLRVSRAPGIPLPPMYRGETEFHEIAYRLLQCLQFPARYSRSNCVPNSASALQTLVKNDRSPMVKFKANSTQKFPPDRILYDAAVIRETCSNARDEAACRR